MQGLWRPDRSKQLRQTTHLPANFFHGESRTRPERQQHYCCMTGQEKQVMVIWAWLGNAQYNKNDQQRKHSSERDFLNRGKGRTSAIICWRRYQGMESRKLKEHKRCVPKHSFESVLVGATTSTRCEDLGPQYLRAWLGRDSDGAYRAT